MQDRLTELDVRQFVERLSTRDPVPGGGSAAALAGAMAAALVHMVVELTSGRPDAAGHDDTLSGVGAAAVSWRSELLNLAELDANAYDSVVRARRLPRGTERERQMRAVQVAAATRDATRAPLQTMRAAAEVLVLAERLAPIASRHAITDVGVAAILAITAMRGAALNVRINLQSLHDDALRAEAATTLDELIPGLGQRDDALRAMVEERM